MFGNCKFSWSISQAVFLLVVYGLIHGLRVKKGTIVDTWSMNDRMYHELVSWSVKGPMESYPIYTYISLIIDCSTIDWFVFMGGHMSCSFETKLSSCRLKSWSIRQNMVWIHDLSSLFTDPYLVKISLNSHYCFLSIFSYT